MLRPPTPLALLALTACTGGMVTDIYPNGRIMVEGVPFTVIDTPRGLTVRNFETGATDPALLLAYAGRAAEIQSGCRLNTITKETGVNTYYASVSCPT